MHTNGFDTMDILAGGLAAQRVRMNTTSSNLANAQTTRTPEGGPYRRRDPVFAAGAVDPLNFSSSLTKQLMGVQVTEVVTDEAPPRQSYDPTHPDSDADGYVHLPNINLIEEMVNMLGCSKSYDAQVTALQVVCEMNRKPLVLGDA